MLNKLKEFVGTYWYYQTVAVVGSLGSILVFGPGHLLPATLGVIFSVAYAVTKIAN